MPEPTREPSRPAPPAGLERIPVWVWVVFFSMDGLVFGGLVLWLVISTSATPSAQPPVQAPANGPAAQPKTRPKAAASDWNTEGRSDPAPLPAPPPGTFRVAALQFVSEFGDVAHNRARLTEMIREAARNGARIVVMPEAAIPGYLSPDLRTPWRDPVRRPNPKDGRSLVEADVAEFVPGPSTRHFGALAKELSVRIVATLIEKVQRPKPGGGDRIDYFNAAVLLGPNGEIEAHYRKLHPWPVGEATWAQPGDRGLAVRDTEFGKLGLLICYDLSRGVPERLKAAGVTTLLYPIGWVCPDARAWFDEMLPQKVKQWGMNLVGANWSLKARPTGEHAWQGYGHTRIVGTGGQIRARAKKNTGSEIVYADLPLPMRRETP